MGKDSKYKKIKPQLITHQKNLPAKAGRFFFYKADRKSDTNLACGQTSH